jgi:hypothetical protein
VLKVQEAHFQRTTLDESAPSQALLRTERAGGKKKAMKKKMPKEKMPGKGKKPRPYVYNMVCAP